MKAKSRRKIWSLPLVFVTALLLVGLFAASVLAQTAPSLVSANINAAINGDSPPATEVTIATVTVEDFGEYEPVAEFGVSDGPPPVPAFNNPAIIGGPTFRNDVVTENIVTEQIFQISDLTPVTGDATMREANISLTAAATTGLDNGDLTLSNSYSFRVQIILDEDGEESDDEDSVLERDLTLTANVRINVLKRAADELRFDVDPSKALKNAQVSQLGQPIDSNPLQWQITGIGSSMKLVDIVQDDNEDDFELRETPAGSGKFGLFVVNSTPDFGATSDLEIMLQYDEDKAVNDNPPDDPDAIDEETEDTVADNDVNVTITLNGTITSRASLAFTGDNFTEVTEGPDTLNDGEDFHYEFTIASNTVEDTPIGSFGIEGDIEIADTSGAGEDDNSETEYLDGIVSGTDAAPFDVRDSDMTLTYDGTPDLEVGTYEFDLTVSGDAGLANRTIIGKVKVTVTASNEAPGVPAAFTPDDVNENEPSVEIVIDNTATPPVTTAVRGLVMGDTEVGDASVGVDAGDGDSLTYTLDAAGRKAFAINPSTGMVSVGSDGISNSTPPAEDATDGKYTRDDGGVLESDTDPYSKITYSFMVGVSDGITANNKQIPATVNVVPNRPAALNPDVTLDDDVMFRGEETDGVKLHVHPVREGTPGSIFLFNVESGLFMDPDAGDTLASTLDLMNARDPFYIDGDGNVYLSYLPTGTDRPEGGWDIIVTVDDGFNRADNTEILDANGDSQVPKEYELDNSQMVKVTLEIDPIPEASFPVIDDVSIDEETTGECCACRSSEVGCAKGRPAKSGV